MRENCIEKKKSQIANENCTNKYKIPISEGLSHSIKHLENKNKKDIISNKKNF